MLAGVDQETAAKMILRDDLSKVKEKLTGLPVRFNYKASPSLDDIETSIAAYEEVYGDYPSLIVVDNVTNVRSEMSSDDGDPFSGLEGLMDYLHEMARETQACVIGLHHVTGAYNDGKSPIPLSGVKGQISRVPELILTLHKRPGNDFMPDTLCVAAVKNRGGKSDASGKDAAELEFFGDKMLIKDPEFKPAVQQPAEVPEQPQDERRERALADPFGGGE